MIFHLILCITYFIIIPIIMNWMHLAEPDAGIPWSLNVCSAPLKPTWCLHRRYPHKRRHPYPIALDWKTWKMTIYGYHLSYTMLPIRRIDLHIVLGGYMFQKRQKSCPHYDGTPILSIVNESQTNYFKEDPPYAWNFILFFLFTYLYLKDNKS